MAAVNSQHRNPLRTRARATAALLSSVALLAACGGAEAQPIAKGSPTPSASSSPTPPPAPKPPAVSPLTGTAPLPTSNVVGIKIDNSPLARPYFRGLDKASLIYQELMEGGSTRFLAIYGAANGAEVGPIRSVREGDIELLRQFGKVALGSSGGNTGVLATLAKAERGGQILDVSFDTVPGPYRKGERRKDAINFYTTPAKIDAAKPSGTRAKDIGLRFAPLPPGAGQPAAKASIRFSEISKVTVQHDAATGTYAVFQDGTRMPGFAPTNVVVQHVKIRMSRYVDVVGNRTPFTETIGDGPVAVLRDGRRLSGTWRRQQVDWGTRFLDDKGRDLPLKPGPTLVLLVPSGQPLTVG